jgi:hypothetical protein
MAGVTWSFGVGTDVWVLKLDVSGDILWEKTYGGGVGGDAAQSVCLTSDGGFLLAGPTYSFGPNPPYGNIWLLKLDASGNVLWQKAFGSTPRDYTYSAQETVDGGIVLVGETDSFFGGGEQEIWLLKLDASGNITPSCSFSSDTGIAGVDSSATVTVTVASVADSPTTPVATSAVVADSSAIIDTACRPFFAYDSHTVTDCGNADGVVDPGETITFNVTVQDFGYRDAFNVSGILSTITPGIAIATNSSLFPDVLVGGSGTSLTPFEFVVDSGVPCGTFIDFTLDMTSEDVLGNPSPSTAPFQVMVGSIGGPTILLSQFFTGGLGTWTIMNGGTNVGCGAACTWTTSDPCALYIFPTPYALVDGWCAGVAMNEQMLTPLIDCGAANTVSLEFAHEYADYSVAIGDVKVRSTNTGGAWVTKASYFFGKSGTVVLDITDEAAGATDVQANWHFYNVSGESLWAVDNVYVKGTLPTCNPAVCPTPPLEPSRPGSSDLLEIPTMAADKIVVEKVPNETGYVVYEGTIGTWYGTPSQTCLDTWSDLGSTVELGHSMAPGDRWVVVSGANAVGESSCGTDSDDVERNTQPGWPAPGPCP